MRADEKPVVKGNSIKSHVFTLEFFKNRLAASVSALALAASPFIGRQITARLLTEPLHLLLTICAIFAFLKYIQRRDCRWLFGCAGFLGLDYLTRPNGLIMAIAAIGTLALSDLISYLKAGPNRPSFPSWLLRLARNYLVAAVIFLAVAIPSWAPRLIYYGSPFHHGYLENYMWVDTYKEGHVGQSYAAYTWRDYFAQHGLGDVLARLIHALRNIYLRIPVMTEKVPLL